MFVPQVSSPAWNFNFDRQLFNVGSKNENILELASDAEIKRDIALDGSCVSFGCVA